MENSGLVALTFLENTRLRIVSAGEQHGSYDIFNMRAPHEWLNRDIIDNAYLIVEDLYFSLNYSFKHIIPRYFKEKNIFSADDIRETCFLHFGSLSTVVDVGDIKNSTRKFVHNFIETLTYGDNNAKLDTRYIKAVTDVSNAYMGVGNAHYQNLTNFIKFIEMTATANNIFNMLYGSKVNINNDFKNLKETYAEITEKEFTTNKNEINEFVKSLGKDPKCIDLIAIYEYMFLLYHIVNLLLRCTKWCCDNNIKLDPQETFAVLQKTVLNKYITVFNYVELFAIIYDCIAVFKLLELYELQKDGKKLIWICSGVLHNKFIVTLTQTIFSLINDPYTENSTFYGLTPFILFVLDKPPNAKNIDSDDFVQYIKEHAYFGFRAPDEDAEYLKMLNTMDDPSKMIEITKAYVDTKKILSNSHKADFYGILEKLNSTLFIKTLMNAAVTKSLFLYKNRETYDTDFAKTCEHLCLDQSIVLQYDIFKTDPFGSYMNPCFDGFQVLENPHIDIPPYTMVEFLQNPANIKLDDPRILATDSGFMKYDKLLAYIEPHKKPGTIFDYNDYLDIEEKYNTEIEQLKIDYVKANPNDAKLLSVKPIKKVILENTVVKKSDIPEETKEERENRRKEADAINLAAKSKRDNDRKTRETNKESIIDELKTKERNISDNFTDDDWQKINENLEHVRNSYHVYFNSILEEHTGDTGTYEEQMEKEMDNDNDFIKVYNNVIYANYRYHIDILGDNHDILEAKIQSDPNIDVNAVIGELTNLFKQLLKSMRDVMDKVDNKQIKNLSEFYDYVSQTNNVKTGGFGNMNYLGCSLNTILMTILICLVVFLIYNIYCYVKIRHHPKLKLLYKK